MHPHHPNSTMWVKQRQTIPNFTTTCINHSQSWFMASFEPPEFLLTPAAQPVDQAATAQVLWAPSKRWPGLCCCSLSSSTSQAKRGGPQKRAPVGGYTSFENKCNGGNMWENRLKQYVGCYMFPKHSLISWTICQWVPILQKSAGLWVHLVLKSGVPWAWGVCRGLLQQTWWLLE